MEDGCVGYGENLCGLPVDDPMQMIFSVDTRGNAARGGSLWAAPPDDAAPAAGDGAAKAPDQRRAENQQNAVPGVRGTWQRGCGSLSGGGGFGIHRKSLVSAPVFEKPGSATFRAANRLPCRKRPAAGFVPGKQLLCRRRQMIAKAAIRPKAETKTR